MSKDAADSQQPEKQQPWHIELLRLPNGQIPYLTFRSSLNPYEAELLDLCVEEILARAGINVCETNWGKALGAGLYEFRIHRSINTLVNHLGIERPGKYKGDKAKLLRVFFTVEGQKIILLLSGYDKGKDRSPRKQQKMIEVARGLLKRHKFNT
jgi:hypothetical protein